MNAQNIPRELAAMRNWLVWRLVQKEQGKKPDKIPYYINGAPRPGTQGTEEDRAQMVTLADAVACVKDSRGHYSGIGFAIFPDSGIVALDFDRCIDAGVIDPRVETLCDGTYTEISPSGSGIRAFFKGSLKSQADAHAKYGSFPFEVFGSNGYVTVTGNVTESCALWGWDICDLTEAVCSEYAARGWCVSDRSNDDVLASLEPTLGWSIEQARGYLTDCAQAPGYDDWLHAGMALHHEFSGSAAGLDLYNEWSAQVDGYAGRRDVESHWRSFGNHRGKPITARWLLWWRNECLAKAGKDGGRIDMTDAGNANALFDRTAGNLRYVTERKTWMLWDGSVWRLDESGSAAKGSALSVAEMWLQRAREKESEAQDATGDDRKRLAKLAESYRSWASHCRNRRGIDNMLALAARDDRFAVSVSALDVDRFALGVANGVVDLRTGQLRPAGRDDFITKRCPFPFNPDALAPRWCTFVDEITGLPVEASKYRPRPALASYLQKAIGYAATGLVVEQKMLIAVGAGSNGKNVLFDILAAVLGPYCVQIPPDAMMASGKDVDGERPTPFARNLAGARLAYGSEAKEGQKLNAAWIKKQTGDAKLTARGLHESPFTFDVTHKLFLLTNHQPHLDHLDDATCGRFHLIPFDRRWNRPGLPIKDPALPDGDKHLMEKLMGEAEGILAWVVRGAVAYLREGLEPPAEVAAKTLDYFSQQDALGRWLQTVEACMPKQGTSATSLYGWFTSWCTDEGLTGSGPTSVSVFGRALQSHGIACDRTRTGTVWGLRAPDVSELF